MLKTIQWIVVADDVADDVVDNVDVDGVADDDDDDDDDVGLVG